MPLIWRYLLSQFLKITFACIIAFVAILLTMQLDDIAHFAALGAPLNYILLFTLYQIPYILPLALPLSCLIASLLLFHRMSHSHELSALRASGFSLKDILAPILLAAAFLSIVNFIIISEVSSYSHLRTHLLKRELKSINPLVILQNKHLMKLKGFYFESLVSSRSGDSASNVIFAIPNSHHERIHLMLAKDLNTSKDKSADDNSLTHIEGKQLTFITGMMGEKEDDFDQLLVENIGSSTSHIQDLSEMIQKKIFRINNDYLRLPLLLESIKEQKEWIREAGVNLADKAYLDKLQKQLNRSYSEIAKRLSIAWAVFSFTLLGAAFGINISRSKQLQNLYWVIGLTTFYLTAFFVAKEVDQHNKISVPLFLAPHVILTAFSFYFIRRATKGIESC